MSLRMQYTKFEFKKLYCNKRVNLVSGHSEAATRRWSILPIMTRSVATKNQRGTSGRHNEKQWWYCPPLRSGGKK